MHSFKNGLVSFFLNFEIIFHFKILKVESDKFYCLFTEGQPNASQSNFNFIGVFIKCESYLMCNLNAKINRRCRKCVFVCFFNFNIKVEFSNICSFLFNVNFFFVIKYLANFKWFLLFSQNKIKAIFM